MSGSTPGQTSDVIAEPVARRGGIPRGIATSGPALLAYGFRPFFLGAGLFGVLSMVLWLGALIGGWPIGGKVYAGFVWHAHEMIFGYATAALAGFMLTAIPNWTGRLPVSGRPLALLVALWAAGRLVMAAPDLLGAYPSAVIDGAFLPVLALIAGREIVAGRNWKNLKILVGLGLLSAVNIALHVAILGGHDAAALFRAGIAVFIMLIALVGGRIVPSFTRNWLARQGLAPLPQPFGRLDIVAMTITGLALATWIVLPADLVTAGTAFLAALAQLARLAGWRGHRTLPEPLVAVLHAGYLFVPLGLVAIGLAALHWLSPTSALHVLTVGAIGVMTLAVMTRATLGHTGRRLAASKPTLAAYLALLAAALVRPTAEMAPDLFQTLAALSAAGWIAAFGLFLVEYGPMLLQPRVSDKRGQAPAAQRA